MDEQELKELRNIFVNMQLDDYRFYFSDHSFKDIFCRCADCFSLNKKELADMFGVSKTTIVRWKKGRYQPHRLIQAAIFKCFKKMIYAEIRRKI